MLLTQPTVAKTSRLPIATLKVDVQSQCVSHMQFVHGSYVHKEHKAIEVSLCNSSLGRKLECFDDARE
jgi:hypothetical protein